VLKEHGISNWRCKKRPKITPEVARKRLAFAKAHVNWTLDQWLSVIWSDECSVQRGSGKKIEWCFRTPSQKWNKEFI